MHVEGTAPAAPPGPTVVVSGFVNNNCGTQPVLQSPVTVSRKTSKALPMSQQERSLKFYVETESDDEDMAEDERDRASNIDEEDDDLDELEKKLSHLKSPTNSCVVKTPNRFAPSVTDKPIVASRTVPPPLPLLSPVFMPKPIVALDFHGKPKPVADACKVPTTASLAAELSEPPNPQLHPLDCLARAFQRAEEEAMLLIGRGGGSDRYAGFEGASGKPVRKKRIPVYSCIAKEMEAIHTRSTDRAEGSSFVPPDSLVFDSKFECGNLAAASRIPFSMTDPRNNRQNIFQQEYDLLCRNDLHTRGNTQWFFFSATGNFKKGMRVRFNITNMRKPDSICNYGMRPAIFSQKANLLKGQHWTQGGSDVCYFKGNTMHNDKKGKRKHFYTLSFVYEFEHADDKVFFAYNYPYSYTMLQEYLQEMEKDSAKRHFIRRINLCRTISGNNCDLITVTGKTASMAAMNKRQVIVISARVHPGETVGSWMMHGLMEFLTGESNEAQVLRENFIFKLIPMLNPDGVINGNYRSNLAGVDLNRRWSKPNRIWHPTIHSLKDMIGKLNSTRGVLMYCDLHGHSRKKNVFLYACCPTSTHKTLLPNGITAPSKHDKGSYLKAREDSRLFSYIMSHVKGGGGSDVSLNFLDSAFKVKKSKKSTARVVVWHELGVPLSFTVEASFCGNGNNMFDAKCRTKYKQAFKNGLVGVNKFGKVSTKNIDVADDEAGATTQGESIQSKASSCPKSPGVDKLYAQKYEYTHYRPADLCAFGRVIAKSLLVYYDLVDPLERHIVEKQREETFEELEWRRQMIGMRSRLAADLRRKLQRQYDLKLSNDAAKQGIKLTKASIPEADVKQDDDFDVVDGDVGDELPDSDVMSQSAGSDSEPSADNLDESELLSLDSFSHIMNRVDKKKAKAVRKKMSQKKSDSKKTKEKEKKKVPVKKSAEQSRRPRRGSLAREYQNAAKGYAQRPPPQKEATTVLWKESVSLNLFDKAMNNDKLRSTEQKFWLVNTKNDISALLGKMSLEANPPAEGEDKPTPLANAKEKKTKKGYGSDRIHRASREHLVSAPASLYDGKKLQATKSMVEKTRLREERREKILAQHELKNRTRRTLARKPVDSGSDCSDGSNDNLMPPSIPFNERCLTMPVIENPPPLRRSKVSVKDDTGAATKSVPRQSRPVAYSMASSTADKTIFAQQKNAATTDIGLDVEFTLHSKMSHSGGHQRTFNKPRKPPPQFRGQSRSSLRGSGAAARHSENSNAPTPYQRRRNSIPVYPHAPGSHASSVRMSAPQINRNATGTFSRDETNFSTVSSGKKNRA